VISFEVLGVDKAIAKFVELQVATSEAVKVGAENGAKAVLARAQQLVPVDTGALKESLHIQPDSGGGELVGTDLPYAIFPEFGLTYPAEPFLRPAADEAAPQITQQVADVLGKVIGSVVGL